MSDISDKLWGFKTYTYKDILKAERFKKKTINVVFLAWN